MQGVGAPALHRGVARGVPRPVQARAGAPRALEPTASEKHTESQVFIGPTDAVFMISRNMRFPAGICIFPPIREPRAAGAGKRLYTRVHGGQFRVLCQETLRFLCKTKPRRTTFSRTQETVHTPEFPPENSLFGEWGQTRHRVPQTLRNAGEKCTRTAVSDPYGRKCMCFPRDL